MALDGFGRIAEHLRRCTGQVASGRRSEGAGIVVKSGAVIVTNAHVVRDSRLMVRLCAGAFPE